MNIQSKSNKILVEKLDNGQYKKYFHLLVNKILIKISYSERIEYRLFLMNQVIL